MRILGVPAAAWKAARSDDPGGESRAAGTYGAAPGSGAGSDAALSLAPGNHVTHLCTNTAHMAEALAAKRAGRGGFGKAGRKGREAVPRAPRAAGTRRDAPGSGGKEAAEVSPAGCFPRLGANSFWLGWFFFLLFFFF